MSSFFDRLRHRLRPSDEEAFKRLFKFKKQYGFHVGVEREGFITDESGLIVPKAKPLLGELGTWSGDDFGTGWAKAPPVFIPNRLFSHELSACQIEGKTNHCILAEVPKSLRSLERELAPALKQLGLRVSYKEVAPADMPLEVYPDPSGRYQELTRAMPQEVLSAACRIIGTHIHIGMPDHETALRVYNHVIQKTKELCAAGDRSNGERLALYGVVASNPTPEPYEDWNAFYAYACEQGFQKDPRRCWKLIRISVHGTIEFRMFGATEDLRENYRWARLCHDLCLDAF